MYKAGNVYYPRTKKGINLYKEALSWIYKATVSELNKRYKSQRFYRRHRK